MPRDMFASPESLELAETVRKHAVEALIEVTNAHPDVDTTWCLHELAFVFAATVGWMFLQPEAQQHGSREGFVTIMHQAIDFAARGTLGRVN